MYNNGIGLGLVWGCDGYYANLFLRTMCKHFHNLWVKLFQLVLCAVLPRDFLEPVFGQMLHLVVCSKVICLTRLFWRKDIFVFVPCIFLGLGGWSMRKWMVWGVEGFQRKFKAAEISCPERKGSCIAPVFSTWEPYTRLRFRIRCGQIKTESSKTCFGSW